jgi:cytochrome oxidase assembly protein ShyY1
MNRLQTWKRWTVWLLLVTIFSVACFFLSQWQFNRRAEAVAKINSVAANFDQVPVPISELASLNSFSSKFEWRPVSLSGRFLSEKSVLVRNRPYNGAPGFLQVIPFELSTGQIIAVETGWLPTASDNNAPKNIPTPDQGDQQIIGRVRPTEPTLNRDAPAGQIATINIDALIEKVKLTAPTYRNVYVRLADSYTDAPLPKVLPKPELTEGNHLSYALQWILFALMAFGALWWAVRQESEAKKIANDPSYKPKLRKKVGDADKAAEDAIS